MPGKVSKLEAIDESVIRGSIMMVAGYAGCDLGNCLDDLARSV